MYGIEWKPSEITWLVDGVAKLRLDTSHEAVWRTNKPSKIVMNLRAPDFTPWGDQFTE